MYPSATKYHFTENDIRSEELEIRAAMDDLSKFSVLYDRYYVQIFRFVYQRTDSEDSAADLTSQVFLKAMLSLKKYQFRGLPFASWLYRVATNEVNLEYRKNKLQRVFSTSTENLLNVAQEFPDDGTEDMIQSILKSLNTLNYEEMELMEMRYFEKRPFKEIAEITGITENNLKVKVHRIIQKLKDKVIKKARQ
jgi:RNA polymerase sigma-70 factor (ECF subfamily)